MRLGLWAGEDPPRPSGLSCKERSADVGNARPARLCQKGGDNTNLQCEEGAVAAVWRTEGLGTRKEVGDRLGDCQGGP